jgi:hypothetical protein
LAVIVEPDSLEHLIEGASMSLGCNHDQKRDKDRQMLNEFKPVSHEKTG